MRQTYSGMCVGGKCASTFASVETPYLRAIPKRKGLAAVGRLAPYWDTEITFEVENYTFEEFKFKQANGRVQSFNLWRHESLKDDGEIMRELILNYRPIDTDTLP